jgi:hypothetical protein
VFSVPKITKKEIILIILGITAIIAVSVLTSLIFGFPGGVRIDSIILAFFVFSVPILLVYFGLKSLNNLIWINVCISGCLVLSLLFFLWSLPIAFFVTAPLFFYAVVMLIINLISLFVFWEEHDSKAFIPLLISVLTIPAMISAGKASRHIDAYLDDYTFKKELPKYEAAIKILEKKLETGPFDLYGDEMPNECQPLASNIIGEKHGNEFVIKLLQGREGGYIYFSGNDSNLPEDFVKYRKVTAHWYKTH